MMVSITGTPGVGKTTVSKDLETIGWRYLDLKLLISESGAFDEIAPGREEVLVDELGLREHLESMDLTNEEQIVLDGHLSYLAPSDICIVLRLDPRIIEERLRLREYSREKIQENVEAEAVSVILVEALEMEGERLGSNYWRHLPSGCGIVFELNVTDLPRTEVRDKLLNIIDAYRGKRLNELSEYRPGRIDWLEEMVGWS